MELDVGFKLPQEISTEILRLVEEDGPEFRKKTFTKDRLARMSEEELSSWNARRLLLLDEQDSQLSRGVSGFADLCFSKLGIDRSPEKVLGNFIGVQHPGAWVQAHTDPVSDAGWWHLRLNFLVQKPDAGGIVLLGDFSVELDVGEWWLNFASSRKHACTTVSGERARVILSLGTYVEPGLGARLLAEYESFLSGALSKEE